jgi:preprotein translocase subunit YajC
VLLLNGSLEVKFFNLVATVCAVLLPSSAALAQTAPAAASGPALSVGATVYDPQGAEVGKIASMAADTLVIDTGAHKATLPKSAIGKGAKGPTVTITKAQIDAQVAAATEKASAALNAALSPGAEVRGKAGAPIGTVKEVKGDQVVIDRASGPVSLTKQAFAVGPQGLTISLTAAELDAAAQSASPTS